MSTLHNYTSITKSIATQLGFAYCGIAKAELLSDDARRLETWLHQGMHGKMQYMENHFDKRIDPTKLVDDAKSVITLLLNYYPSETQIADAPKIAKYAYGQDYHDVIREKLHQFLALMNAQIGEIHGRGFVDSAPVLERAWALKSGLGWIGKNGNIINKQAGSFYFIATLIVDIELEYDNPFLKDYCGTCTKCIDACPTDAILPNKIVDGNKCISYYTIELKDALIDSNKNFEGWAFGCDVCQDVCPWNRFSKANTEIKFTPIPEILNLSTKQWQEMSEENFKIIFKDSPIKRSKFSGIQRNIKLIASQQSTNLEP
jgi:epoxyqueuosine reductase